MKNRLLIGVIFCACTSLLFAQFPPPVLSRYNASTGDVALVAAGTTATLQSPALLPGKQISLEAAIVYCSVACNVSQAANGTAATATAGTANAIPSTATARAAVATFWTASNVGAGTSTGPIIHQTAAGTAVIDLSKVQLPAGSGSGTNYSITISSITGTVNITFIWSEK